MRLLKIVLCMLLALLMLTAKASELTLDELKAFADKVEESVERDSGKFIDTSLDKEFFGARCTRGNAKQKLKRQFIKGFFKTFKYGPAIAKTAESGHYRMVRCYKKGAKRHIIFRLVSNGTLNYHDYWLVRNRDGKIKIVDCYVYTSGENLSDTINRMFIQWNASTDTSFMNKLLQKGRKFNKNMKNLANMSKAMRANRPKEAIRLYKSLSTKFQKQKFFMLIACTNYAKFDNTAYQAKLKEYKKLFPGDPSLSLLLIDYYFLKKEYANSLKMINQLDENLGGDAYLNLFRAYVFQQQGNLKKTMRYAKKTMTALPYAIEAYSTFLAVALGLKDFASVTEGLTLLGKSGFDISRKDILADPEYKDYVRSKEFKKWSAANLKSGEVKMKNSKREGRSR